MSKIKKQKIVLDGKAAFVNSANKLNRSMPEVFRGCGQMGDTKYNRRKEKRALHKEIKSNMKDSFLLIKNYCI